MNKGLLKQKRIVQWQGEDVNVVFGFCEVKENTEKPLYWYNYDIAIGESKIPAIKVITNHDHEFVISNRHGVGIEKLVRGGWPNFPHASLELDDFQESNENHEEYNPEALNKRDREAEQWFENNFGHTEDWKKSQALKEMILKSRS